MMNGENFLAELWCFCLWMHRSDHPWMYKSDQFQLHKRNQENLLLCKDELFLMSYVTGRWVLLPLSGGAQNLYHILNNSNNREAISNYSVLGVSQTDRKMLWEGKPLDLYGTCMTTLTFTLAFSCSSWQNQFWGLHSNYWCSLTKGECQIGCHQTYSFGKSFTVSKLSLTVFYLKRQQRILLCGIPRC